MMLAHAATFQGIRALDAIMGVDDNLRLDVIPAAVFTMPEVGMVGLTEDDCKAQGIEYVAKKAFSAPTARRCASTRPTATAN